MEEQNDNPLGRYKLSQVRSSEASQRFLENSSLTKPLEIFILCSRNEQDQELLARLERDLLPLRRKGTIALWHEGILPAGAQRDLEIAMHLRQADIVLLLISPDFLASDTCHTIQHSLTNEASKKTLIPILLRPCHWEDIFDDFEVLPSNHNPITSWSDIDKAFYDVLKGLRRLLEARIIEYTGHSYFSPPAQLFSQNDHLPLNWNLPYQRNPFFTGREDVLILMHELLTTQKRAVLTQALTGLGGIGKTQTAIEYIYRHHQEYTAILWARGHSQEALIADFTNVARTLHLPINQDSDQQHIILAVKQWFNTHTNWLLFLDDVDDVETLADFLPQGGIGHVILTTRARSVGTIANAVVIEKWPVADGALFLLRRAKKMKADESIHIASDKDQSVAREITQLLDGLPLALDQAGAYIEETGCSLDHYLHLYQQRRMELLHRRGKQTSHHPESVAATFSLCFEKVAQINPIAVEILHCCSWLDPDHIPEEIITEGATELGSVLFPLSSNPFLFDEAVADLGRYSLIQRHAETRTLSTHRLVQAVLTDMVGKPQQKIWAERVVQAVCSLFPGKEGANWQHLQRYLAQIQACAALIEQWEVRSGAIVAWLFRVGHLCETCGFHAVAERLYLLGNAVRKANLSDGIAGVFGQDFADELVLSPAMDTLSSASPLSRLYYQQGKYTQAEQLNRRFVELLEQQFGSQHPVLIGHLNNLAATYSTTGRYKEAEVLLQRALDIHFQTGEVDLDELATLLNGLAELYRKQEKYDQAEPLYQQVLEIAERANDPLKLADRSHNLALVYRAQRKYDEAEQLYQRAQTIYETVYGPENAYLARTLNSLGVVYLCQKRYSEAEVLLLKALAMREKVLGLEHPDVARTLNNLGNLYVNLENYQQAQRVLQRSVETYTKSLGPEHVETAMSLANLGQTYYGQNKYVEAEASLEKALDIHEQTIGLQAPDVMQIFQALVLVYIAQKKALRIQQVCQRILPALKARLGEHHKDVRAIQDMLMHFSPENIRTGFIQTSFSKRSHHQRNKKRRKKR